MERPVGLRVLVLAQGVHAPPRCLRDPARPGWPSAAPAGVDLLGRILRRADAAGAERVVVASETPARRMERLLGEHPHGGRAAALEAGADEPAAEVLLRCLDMLGEEPVVTSSCCLECSDLSALRVPDGAEALLPLASGRPSAVRPALLTDASGMVTGEDGGGRTTNLLASGTLAVRAEAARRAGGGGSLAAALLRAGVRIRATLAGGRPAAATDAESFLRLCHEILAGAAPGGAETDHDRGRLLEGEIDAGSLEASSGTLWVAPGASVSRGAELRDCMVMYGSGVGEGCRLRSCLVLPRSHVRPGTDASDKYLSVIGKPPGR